LVALGYVKDNVKSETFKITVLSLNEEERKALDEYQSRLELITKLREEWADANASERTDLRESVSALFPNLDLSVLESGKQTIENALSDLGISAFKTVKGQITNYSDELFNMLTEAFGEVNITPYFEEVEKYQNLLTEVQSGKIYDDAQIKAIIRDNEDLADAVKAVENGYKLEENAVISLLNTSITAYNKKVSSAKITTTDILKERQRLMESYGLEAKVLSAAENLKPAENPHTTFDELALAYNLTSEQVSMLEDYVALIEEIRQKYKELKETVDEGTDDNSNNLNKIASDYESKKLKSEAWKNLEQSILEYKELTTGVTSSDYDDLINYVESIRTGLENQLKALQEEYATVKDSLTDAEKTEWESTFLNLSAEIQGCTNEIINLENTASEADLSSFDNSTDFIDRFVTNAETKLEALKAAYEDATTFDDKNDALTNLIESPDGLKGYAFSAVLIEYLILYCNS